MKKNKIFIEKNNYHRVLLTDLLPYETPLIFSNDGFYKYINSRNELHTWILNTVMKSMKYTFPYSYKIKKSLNTYRTLSIIHPEQQKKFVDFYKKYDFLMISQCSKSTFTLRKPSKVVGQYYENDDEVLIEDDNIKVSSNYFHYTDYSHMYKFFDSYESHRLEKKFSYFMSLDISKCFYNIYTHSICWAVKSKDYAKANTPENSFENEFDKLMQNSNYNETNGILVGPEISRIFAEIIFQRIDLNIESKLSEIGLKHKLDYDIKRYIDDYFIYVNEKRSLEVIKNIIEDQLEYYKLYLNDAKTKISEPPFITNITMAKMSISFIINNYFDFFIFLDDESKLNLKSNPRYFNRSHKMIEDIKKEVKTYNLKYNEVNNYVLKVIKKKITTFITRYEYSLEDNNKVIQFFKFILDVIFFMYPMDVRINTTYSISHIIIDINEYIKKTENKELSFSIRKKIIDESLFVIKKVCTKEKKPSIEVLNLLLVISEVGREYLTMDNDTLKVILQIYDETKLDYFQIISLLYFIKDDPTYSGLKELILNNVRNKLITYDFNKAENYMLFFDIMTCPYISIEIKKSYLPNNIEKQNIIDSITHHLWFTDWSRLNMKRLLHKKELKLPYER